jgi:hypothetical protein
LCRIHQNSYVSGFFRYKTKVNQAIKLFFLIYSLNLHHVLRCCFLSNKKKRITMSLPTFEQFRIAKQGSSRKAAKSKWWQFAAKKVSPEEKRKRRFEGDTRPYSERNAGHRTTANNLSYFFQLVSISGAVYGAYRMFWDASIMGGVLLGFALVVLWQYEKLARWTSDKFWDERAAGRYDLKFAALNFGVIWSIGLLLTVCGVYFLLNDVQPEADGSISVNDPAYVQMQAQVANARNDIKKADDRVADFKKDRSNLCKDNGKWVVCYNRRKAMGKLDGAIVTAENRLTAATDQMAARFSSMKILDDRATEYHLNVVDGRFYAQIGLFIFCLLMFEVCMWYRSKYDMMLYWEEEYARAYGMKPKGETKTDKAKKKNGAKKISPRPYSQDGVSVKIDDAPLSSFDEALSDDGEALIEVPELPDGKRFCKLDGCTELVGGRKKFCCDSHRVINHQRSVRAD